MGVENIDKIYKLLDNIPMTQQNSKIVKEVRKCLEKGDFNTALQKIKLIDMNAKVVQEEQPKKRGRKKKNIEAKEPIQKDEEVDENYNEEDISNKEEKIDDVVDTNEIEDTEDEIESDEETEIDNQEEIEDAEDSEKETERYEDYVREYDNEYEEEDNEEDEDDESDFVYQEEVVEDDSGESLYPEQLSNKDLERKYIGMLLSNPKLIVKYNFLHSECHFENSKALNIYKSVLFTEGASYTPEYVKKGFNFAKDSHEMYLIKEKWKEEALENNYNIQEIYISLKKLFILRRAYLEIPIKEIQDRIVEITTYILYGKMSVEEIESAVRQVNDTGKFKRAVINTGLTEFLAAGDNNLRNGLELPFGILSSVFKGIRKGETMAFAMPSNSGKSRFTINLAAYTALIHKKKVLIISNEMSEDKMRLCLITTILNNPKIQNLHGQKLEKTEGELLEFKFRADDPKKVNVDKDGFITKEKGETQEEFVIRLSKFSTEFRNVIKVTNWASEQINNSIYFINITDHTNDELQKVIMNYYYKEKIEYVFYDTLKTDTANIGIGEELKKTATILSNLAQNFDIFICSTLQLEDGPTLPINLTVNDLAVSRTVKEVLDTLCLIKQINRENYNEYEYSLKEVDTKFYNIQKFDDPDVRYYACVVDKNRAGAKPRLVFKLNLAYNSWEELGHLRLKQTKDN